MDTNIARQQADRILQTLERAKYLSRPAALQELEPLREEIGVGDDVERERADAWLAVSALYKMLAETPGHRDIPAHWQRAIDKTAAWLASIK